VSESAYLAHPDFVEHLAEELGDATTRHGRLLLAPGPPRPAAWSQNTWVDARRARIASIADGAKLLRSIQRNWALYEHGPVARARLLRERLPSVSARPLAFGAPRPKAPLGSFTLLAPDELLYAPDCTSAFPNGEVRFLEDRSAPPNRAYLKLWEALTLLDERPRAGETCLDLGSAPGGWTWVLQGLGAHVVSVDKAPLDPTIAALPGVEFRRESAFALEPTSVGPCDWLFSDVACYPARLLALVRRWLESGLCRRFVCTVKLQGRPDRTLLAEFAAIPGASLRHLWHNKHELTWWRL
jgi:23S rRNA (cytidine2498-2'-O)-methyltransferase